jgi:membrane protein CcdC involved in cytochrome C biogenesis
MKCFIIKNFCLHFGDFMILLIKNTQKIDDIIQSFCIELIYSLFYIYEPKSTDLAVLIDNTFEGVKFFWRSLWELTESILLEDALFGELLKKKIHFDLKKGVQLIFSNDCF